MAGKAPFVDLGDLGIDLRLGDDLGMPPVDPGVERATEEMVAEFISSADKSRDSEETISETEAEQPADRAPGPTVADLFGDGERGLEEEAAEGRPNPKGEKADGRAVEVTIAYSTWEDFMDRRAGPTMTFDYVRYL